MTTASDEMKHAHYLLVIETDCHQIMQWFQQINAPFHSIPTHGGNLSNASK
jgi:hypothetical protein